MYYLKIQVVLQVVLIFLKLARSLMVLPALQVITPMTKPLMGHLVIGFVLQKKAELFL
jgi:hypothetical protein